MRLQELAVPVAPGATGDGGAPEGGRDGGEVFTVFQGDLGKFTDAMEKQAGTWQGLTSTIKDSLQLALAEGLNPSSRSQGRAANHR